MVLGFLTGPPSVSRGGDPKNRHKGLQVYKSGSSSFLGNRVSAGSVGKMSKESGDSRDEDVLYHLPYANLERHHESDNVVVPEVFHEGRDTHLKSVDEYKKLYEESIADPVGFWSNIARSFHWKEDFPSATALTYNFDLNVGPIDINWFKGGKTNICYNAVDRQIENGLGTKVAFHYEGNDLEDEHRDITYEEVRDEVCRVANSLKEMGVKKGDCVCLYMPMVPELPIAMLACARIGAVHSVVFGGFSAEALAGRIFDAKNDVVITCDGVMRGKKLIELKKVADDAVKLSEARGHRVGHKLVLKRLGPEKCKVDFVEGVDHWWHEMVKPQSTVCEPEWVDAEDPLFILYTSGSTGQPKGILHTTGGYMVYAATTFKYAFDYQPEDVFFCTADCGWITGHSYVTYGPLLNGATQVVYEGVPNSPRPDRLWRIVDKYKVQQVYTAPTAIRALMVAGDQYVKGTDRSSLKILGTVGEPINPEAWNWYFKVVGDERCPIVDTWWQTETGGHMIMPLPIPGLHMKPGAASLPFFGVVPVILDEDGKEVEGEGQGFLMVKKPWPSTLRSISGDHERMEEVYFSRFKGYYMSGDGCRRDKDGYYWLTGRVDDVLNVSGHRIGTAEVESALVLHPAVGEAAVVGIGHDIKGEGIYAYVTLMNEFKPDDGLKKELIQYVRKEIGPIATPDVIHFAAAVPKTRSGKIMRRILRKIANEGSKVDKAGLGDVSTLADASVVDALIETHAN
mmetsp:Transcript_37029/g.147756  ORF Transcript_37029/g.147756 Transcript_37029/m.147756 type:complete len:738 (-) Transcript_37029:2234-4447(-)